MIAEVPDSREFFNIVFFAVVISTLVQGTTFEPLAQRLGADHQRARAAATAGGIGHDQAARRRGAGIPVAPEDAVSGHRVRELGLPRDALLSVIVREGEAALPRGSTRVEAGDRLHVVVRSEVADQWAASSRRWATGPAARHRQARSGRSWAARRIDLVAVDRGDGR